MGDRGHSPHDTSETHTQAWVQSASPQTLVLRMKAEAPHTLSLGTPPSAPPSALSPCLPLWPPAEPGPTQTLGFLAQAWLFLGSLLAMERCCVCGLPGIAHVHILGKKQLLKSGGSQGCSSSHYRNLLRDALAEGWSHLLFL